MTPVGNPERSADELQRYQSQEMTSYIYIPSYEEEVCIGDLCLPLLSPTIRH